MTSPKTVVHLFHDDADSIRTGVRVAQRVAEVALERGVEIEVFCFGPAQRLLARRDDELGAHPAEFTCSEVRASVVRTFPLARLATEPILLPSWRRSRELNRHDRLSERLDTSQPPARETLRM